ncbi:hypothetical protein [Chengkuizengella axinellae]|uniref:Lipocalin-like domain-containing protein n=1 Tax=Chengkuizengella axinellae TaxID=3064388 RepID=A0ABT9IX75_9BACL|nr:hypothetical protein [Chengkuizengella sp. 2205SS18-9]MDP5273946.1 hypothetical protein [Chengkuizengella sp. 2205SS18-9]
MLKDKLIGSWSVDQMYSPGAQSDDWIVFLNNGIGWFQSCNWGSCCTETFKWSIVNNDLLEINFDKFYGYEDEIEKIESTFKSKIEINKEMTPSGNNVEVITFDEAFYDSKKYGLETKDVSIDRLNYKLKKYEGAEFFEPRYFKIHKDEQVYYRRRESVIGKIPDSYRENPILITQLMIQNLREHFENEYEIKEIDKEEYELNKEKHLE